MKELLEFLKSVSVAEVVMFRTEFVNSCHVVYYDNDKLYVHYFEVADFDELYDYIGNYLQLTHSIEEYKFVPNGHVVSFV